MSRAMNAWADALLQAMLTALESLPPAAVVAVVAMVPVLELRAAIPLGIGLGLEPLTTLAAALIGNLLPIPFLLALLEPAARRLHRHRRLRRLADWMYARTAARSEPVRRYGWWGLTVFVATPLPLTGAWSAAMIAALMGFTVRSALSAIALGLAAAGLVVTGISVLGWSLLR